MSQSISHKRACVRVPFDGHAQLEIHGRVHRFEISDLSFGGIGLIGEAHMLEVGTHVTVLMASTARISNAEVRHINDRQLGLSWVTANLATAERLAHLVEVAACDSAAPIAIVPEQVRRLRRARSRTTVTLGSRQSAA